MEIKKEAHSHVNIIFLSPHLSSLVQCLTLKEISWRFVIFRSDLHLHYPQLVTKLLTHNHQEDITEKTVFWNSTPILLHFCFYHLSQLILLSVTIEHWMGKGIYFSKMTFVFIYYPTALSKVQMQKCPNIVQLFGKLVILYHNLTWVLRKICHNLLLYLLHFSQLIRNAYRIKHYE